MCVCYYISNVGQWPLCMNKLFDLDLTIRFDYSIFLAFFDSLVCVLERDVAQWLERGALPMSLPAVRFRIPLGAGFSEKYHVSPLSILGHYFDVVSLGKTLYPHMLHLTQV